MNNKRSGFRGFGVYLILVLAVIAIWYWLDGNNVTNTYTRQQFETALAEGKVTQVNVVPNHDQSGCSKLRRRKQDDELWQEPCEKNE